MALVNVEDFSFSYQTEDAASRTVLDGSFAYGGLAPALPE